MGEFRTLKKATILLLQLHFVVVAVLPLSNLHVECQSDAAYFIQDKSNPALKAVTLFVHELLFKHFRNHSDQAKYPSADFRRNIDARFFRANPIPKLISINLDYRCGTRSLISCGDHSSTYTSLYSKTSSPLNNFYFFRSCLSPPSV